MYNFPRVKQRVLMKINRISMKSMGGGTCVCRTTHHLPIFQGLKLFRRRSFRPQQIMK